MQYSQFNNSTFSCQTFGVPNGDTYMHGKTYNDASERHLHNFSLALALPQSAPPSFKIYIYIEPGYLLYLEPEQKQMNKNKNKNNKNTTTKSPQ